MPVLGTRSSFNYPTLIRAASTGRSCFNDSGSRCHNHVASNGSRNGRSARTRSHKPVSTAHTVLLLWGILVLKQENDYCNRMEHPSRHVALLTVYYSYAERDSFSVCCIRSDMSKRMLHSVTIAHTLNKPSTFRDNKTPPRLLSSWHFEVNRTKATL
jgi:hypothetical protein